jgi:hypothetical protein
MLRLFPLLGLLLGGCVMGIPDADPPVPKVKPCQVIIVERPENRARCVTRAEFERLMKGILY